MVSANPDFDAIASSTLKNYMKSYEDNVFNALPLTDALSKGAKTYDGGATMVVPLMTAANSTFASFSMYDSFSLTPQEGLSAAEYKFKNLGGIISISGEEKSKNAGSEQLINLLSSKFTQGELTANDVLNTMLYGDGTGNSGKNFDGLGIAITTSTWGGINPATGGNAFWKPVIVDATADGDTVLDTNEWRHAYNTASKGADRPDFGITTQELWEGYESSLIKQERHVNVSSADERFQSIIFAGTKMYWDVACPTGTTFFLNLKHLWLNKKAGEWMKAGKFIEPPDVDGVFAKIISRGNLVVDNRARHAKITGQTLV